MFKRMRKPDKEPGGKPIAGRRGRHRPSENQGSETGEVYPPGGPAEDLDEDAQVTSGHPSRKERNRLPAP